MIRSPKRKPGHFSLIFCVSNFFTAGILISLFLFCCLFERFRRRNAELGPDFDFGIVLSSKKLSMDNEFNFHPGAYKRTYITPRPSLSKVVVLGLFYSRVRNRRTLISLINVKSRLTILKNSTLHKRKSPFHKIVFS